jgi:hypothetical protein
MSTTKKPSLMLSGRSSMRDQSSDGRTRLVRLVNVRQQKESPRI